MHIIKLDAIDSTNSYVRKLCNHQFVEDYTVVVAKYQTKGRGQMGTQWDSDRGKNLMFSVFKDTVPFNLESPFYISMVTTLAIVATLQKLSILKLSIKWPNDILSDDKKICGILIENVFKQNTISNSIIGIGLNVNQTDFDALPKASSLKLITGKIFELDEILQLIIENLQLYFSFLEKREFGLLKDEYEMLLFRKDKPSTFKDVNGVMFSGFIRNVSLTGSLSVELEDRILKEFDLKEITLLY